MESMSSSDSERLLHIFQQILTAIGQLQEWNDGIESADDYYLSPGGMQKLAASCMLIEAIGEGIKQIDRLSSGQLLKLRPEIPWIDVMGMRNHIAHGYFDIDGDLVLSTIKNDLAPLSEAVCFFIEMLK